MPNQRGENIELPVSDHRGHPVVLYDGVCGLCNRGVQVILKRDAKGVFRFAPLQSGLAARILTRHGVDPSEMDTMYVVLNCDPVNGEGSGKESLLSRSDAVLFVLRRLGGAWCVAARAIQLFPRAAREWGYRVVASNRYGIFGRYESCPLPDETTRTRFLDM